jgi:hypothetical protein
VNIEKLIHNLNKYERCRSEYYNLLEFKKMIEQVAIDEIEDFILTPFYITDKLTLEIYDYELYIRCVDKPNFEKYLLNKTGKNSILEIDSKIKEKFKMCYIELEKGKDLKVEVEIFINKYLDYLLNSEEIRIRIEQQTGEFDSKNLYFEFY